MKHFERKISKY